MIEFFASGFETGPVACMAGQKTRGPKNLIIFFPYLPN
jgi:hypothetical protein